MGKEIYYQDVEKNICSDAYGIKRNMRYLALSFGSDIGKADRSFVYGQKELKHLDKQYMRTINPEKHMENIEKQRDYDRKRNQTPERKKMNQAIDRARDQTEERKIRHQAIDENRDKTLKRKKMHQAIDAERNKTPQRKKANQAIDEKRDKTPKRKKMHQAIDKLRYQTMKRKQMFNDYEQTETQRLYKKRKYDENAQNKLISTLDFDTGFDLICSSCLQYKHREYCQNIDTLSKELVTKYIVIYSYLVKNRTEGQFVCNLCLKDIKNNVMPKRSHANKFKFCDFPTDFIQALRKHCNFRESSASILPNREIYERNFLTLNRLESYLLKLVIPFIR